MTVSKVLRGCDGVSPAMRRRVLGEAERLGYRPNPHAVGLARCKVSASATATIALLVGHRDGHPLTRIPSHPLHYHYPRIVAGARERAARLGFGLDVFWVYQPMLRARRLESVLHARSISGLLLLSLDRAELELDWTRYVCANLGRPEHDAGSYAGIDFYAVTRQACLSLRKAGRRRVGLVLDGRHHALTDGRCVGAFLVTAADWPEGERIEPLVTQPHETGPKQVCRWLAKWRPDAVLFLRNRLPELFRKAELGGNVQLVDLDLAEDDGKATGMWLPHEEVGGMGVELLAGELRSAGVTGIATKSILLNGAWRNGTPPCAF